MFIRNALVGMGLVLLGWPSGARASCLGCGSFLSIDFGPGSEPPEAGYERDSGGSFSTGVGYGWLPGGPALASRMRSCVEVPDRQKSLLLSAAHRRWEAALPNGDYTVSVSLGDCAYTQGPQRLALEGVLVVDGETTQAGSFLTVTRTVAVRDGRLSLDVGDGGGLTTINSIDIAPAVTEPETLLSINFQDNSVHPPDSFVGDYGAPYDADAGRGWSHDLLSKGRTRGLEDDPLLDGFVFVVGPAARYEIALPLGYYDVDLSVGDALYPQGPLRLLCEGQTLLDGEFTAAGEFLRLREQVHVSDGRLTLEVGGGGGLTPLNFVTVSTRQTVDLRVNFQPAGSPVPDGYLPDSGSEFKMSRGHGWSWDLGFGKARDREALEDQRLDTLVFVDEASTWEAVVPEGDYAVTVSVGDPSYAQGPHAIDVEGLSAIYGESTLAGEFIERTLRVKVLDGRLSLTVGEDEGGRTTLNYVDIVSLGDVAAIDFQPEDSDTPEGFEPDSGQAYSEETGYGWYDDFLYERERTRERGVLEGRVQDTFIFTKGPVETWFHDLPDGDYRVTLSVGDALYAQGPQRVVVEGSTVVDDEMTAKGQFLVVEQCVTVGDGALTVEIGGTEGHSTLDYLVVTAASCWED